MSKDNAKDVQADGTSNDERSNRWKLWEPCVFSAGSRDIECPDVNEIREKSQGVVVECSTVSTKIVATERWCDVMHQP